MTYNDYGIIFKIRDFGEADKIVSVLTKSHGRVDSIAKGARRPTSRKTGSIDLMNAGKFSFAEGKNLDILLEIDLEHHFDLEGSHIELSKYLFVSSELTDNFFPEISQGEEAYSLLDEFINIVNLDFADNFLSSLELKLLNLGGFGPNTETCNLCGDPLLEGTKRVAHAGSEIGFICEKHIETGQASEISDRILKVIKFLLNNDLVDSKRVNLEKADLEMLRKLQKLWIQSIIGKEIKSYKFLEG